MGLKYISFIIISFFTIYLFGLSFISSFQDNIYVFLVLLFLILGILNSIIREFFLISKKDKKFLKFNFEDIFFVFLGAFIAYVLNIYLKQGAIIAASLVGIISSSFLKNKSIPIYTGAFAGMVSPDLYHDFYHIIIVSLITGIFYVLSKDVFKGIGGKLGATAFVSWVLLSFIFDFSFIKGEFYYDLDFVVFFISFLGVFLTFFLQYYLNKDLVASSSILSLLGALIFPVIFFEKGVDLSVLFMASTFAGMSTDKKINNFAFMVLVSFFVSIIFVYSYSHFGGGGGKLGTISFGCVLGVKGICNFFNRHNIFILKK
ncbi:hypothetical protein [Oceanotoga teriensis]|jgi:hypothetical protein|uniref:hypothetical protein n=1 Tax=Oceanotoga teriensis TaxID=515440 RepID=UPI002712A388|nr:hypothetical protein [Oceanotoga teriensis]MDO7975713.1 hypothetical protein [Oceanotoga teriensis]